VQRLRAEGVPVDGVGHQLHLNVERPSIADIEATFDKFATLGVRQQVTELDVSTYTNFVDSFPSIPATTIAAQGYRYQQLFDLFRRHKAQLDAVTVWGVSDANTWLKSFPFPRLDLPLLFDEQLQAKPAYWGIVDQPVAAADPDADRAVREPPGRRQPGSGMGSAPGDRGDLARRPVGHVLGAVGHLLRVRPGGGGRRDEGRR
jgi:endo-1,4-beta-xylanase